MLTEEVSDSAQALSPIVGIDSLCGRCHNESEVVLKGIAKRQVGNQVSIQEED